MLSAILLIKLWKTYYFENTYNEDWGDKLVNN